MWAAFDERAQKASDGDSVERRGRDKRTELWVPGSKKDKGSGKINQRVGEEMAQMLQAPGLGATVQGTSNSRLSPCKEQKKLAAQIPAPGTDNWAREQKTHRVCSLWRLPSPLTSVLPIFETALALDPLRLGFSVALGGSLPPCTLLSWCMKFLSWEIKSLILQLKIRGLKLPRGTNALLCRCFCEIVKGLRLWNPLLFWWKQCEG